MALVTEFKRVFGEALEPLGFKKVKGRQPYFVRVINDEIIHVIGLMPRPSKGFQIMGGVATVYRRDIDLDENAYDNRTWLANILRFHEVTHPDGCDPEFRQSIQEFYYYDDRGIFKNGTYTPYGELRKTVPEAVKHSLEITEKWMLPVLDNVTSLKACVEYFDKFNMAMNLYDGEGFGKGHYESGYSEGLVLIKIGNRDYFRNKFKKAPLKGRLYERIPEEQVRTLEQERNLQIELNESFIDNPELNAKVLAELERRRAENVEKLREYGL